MIENIKYVINIVYTIFKFIENCIVKPIKKILKVCKPLINWYERLWNNFTHDKYGDFIYKRAIYMIIATIINFYIVCSILGFVIDLGYYLATKKTEIIYLSDSVELDSDDNIWGVKGCPTQDCDSSTALYFRIKTTWFNQIWNLFHHQQLFFADGIAAGVPTGQTKCEVVSYGLRYRILMIYNYYPQILQVKCGNFL